MDAQLRLAAALEDHRAGRLAEAEAGYRAVLQIDPKLPDALHLLGVVRQQRGDAAESERLIRQAIALNPQAPMFHNNLGKALEERGEIADALASYRHAIALAPTYADAHFNVGVALQATGDYVAAEASYRHALELAPAMTRAAHNLSAVIMGQGRPRDARQILRDVLRQNPDDSIAYRGLLATVLYDPDVDEATRFAEHVAFGRRFARQSGPGSFAFGNSRDADRRLRIGWLSSDFRDHPVTRNIEPLFLHRTRSEMEFICYADVAKPDGTTRHFEALADRWRSIEGRTDADAAEMMRADQIDILLVLAGRFDRNRPLVAAYDPAPIKISFHDPGTSGLESMDYLIADPMLVPAGGQEQFSERVVRLPHIYIHAPLSGSASTASTPPSAQTGRITFGSFNNPIKVNDHVTQTWARVMSVVPGSRLALRYKSRFAALSERLRADFASRGVEASRLEVGGDDVDRRDHLLQYNSIDIALDPFPFTGSTTTFEALSMGVPVVTLAGTNMAARWSASILKAVGLDDLVAESLDDYIRIAAGLAKDAGRLAALRRELPNQVASSALCDAPGYTRHFERLLRAVWRRWCAGQRA